MFGKKRVQQQVQENYGNHILAFIRKFATKRPKKQVLFIDKTYAKMAVVRAQNKRVIINIPPDWLMYPLSDDFLTYLSYAMLVQVNISKPWLIVLIGKSEKLRKFKVKSIDDAFSNVFKTLLANYNQKSVVMDDMLIDPIELLKQRKVVEAPPPIPKKYFYMYEWRSDVVAFVAIVNSSNVKLLGRGQKITV